MPYTVTKYNKTYTETIAAIDALGFNDILNALIKRLYPNESFNYEGGGDPSYDTLTFINISKPGLSVFITEDPIYRQELKDSETAWFTETQRVNDIQVRWDALNDTYGAMGESSWTGANPAILLKEIIDNNDETLLSELETKDSDFQTSSNVTASIQAKRKRIDSGLNIIAYIAYLNELNALTEAQILTLMADSNVQSAVNLLSTGSLTTAKSLITSMDITSLPMSESDRTNILAEITKYDN